MGKSSIIFSVLLIISVLWKPAYTDEKCSLGCKGSPTTQSFLNGHKYNYGVEGTVSIYLTGAADQETSVKLLGQVGVASVGNCVHELTIQHLAISGPDGKKYQSPPGVEKPVRFTLQDGRVGAEICAEEDDTRRSLNIKRAIISLLQTEQRASTQVDIFGTCPTDITSSQEGGATLVHRNRDLNRCGHREQGKNDFITAVYNPTAEIKDTQLLQSTLRVETKVNNGVPEKVDSTEEYLYRPFSLGENGARAKVNTKLNLNGKARAASNPSHCTESRTIIFENPHGDTTSQNCAHNALNAIKEAAKTLATEAGTKSAGLFAQVVRILRTGTKEDLMRVYAQVKGNDIEKRVFLDALLRAGTGPSIETSVQLLKSNDLNVVEQKLVYLSLGNARHVNNEALRAAAGLLDVHNIPKEVYLGVGALAGIYCREHSCHNVKNDGVVAISQKLGAKLQNCKPKSKVQEDIVVAVLKGIRNIRHLEDSLIDKLVHCAIDNNVKARVKVAALEAFHADPCAARVKKTAVDIMKNRQLDSEIRIKAYLAIIECPCGQTANEIKNLLESEPINQVGNFISTSLRQIRASSNPDKQLARQHYGLIRTPYKFNFDIRKYSFNEEESFKVDALGLGGTIDRSVIFSQDSFIPRSASLNLTVELFGQNLNVFEIGARQGNLDRIAEHFFGPKSFLRTEEPQKIFDDYIKKPYEESVQSFEKNVRGRGRRSIKADIDSFDKNLRAEFISYNNELDLDVYLKLFGTDAVFLSLGDDKGFDFKKAFGQLMASFNQGCNQLKNFKQELRAHVLFLDAELAYPTATGLPLKLDLVGSATGRLEAATNFDIRAFIRQPSSTKIDIKLVPSTDIEVTGALLVDADVITAGLKVITNLHSSTGGHLVAKFLDRETGIDIQFGLPIEKQEIITASNDLVFYYAEKGSLETRKPVKLDISSKETDLCFDQASDYIGLSICVESSLPFSFGGNDAQASIQKFISTFPLSGSANLKIYLEKVNLRGYHVKALFRNQPPNEVRTIELLFDAEGAKQGRSQIVAELVTRPTEYSAKVDVQTPFKSIFGQIIARTDPDREITLAIKGRLDGSEYYLKGGIAKSGNDQRAIIKPLYEYKYPEHKDIQRVAVDGEIVQEKIGGDKTRYTIQNVKIPSFLPSVKGPICLEGYLLVGSQYSTVDFDVQAKELASVKGSYKSRELTLEFQNSLNPYINFRLKGLFDSTTRNELDLYYSGDCHNSQNRIVVSQMLKYHNDKPDNFNVITKNKFEVYAIPFKVSFDADIDPKKVDVEFDGLYSDRKANFDLEARSQIKKPGDYSVKLKTSVDRNGIEVFSKRDIVSADKSNFENYIEFKNVGKYELSGVVLHKNKPNDVNMGAVGHLKMSAGGQNENIKFDVGVLETSSQYSSHAKVSSNQGELLDYLMKVSRGANANGQLKLIIKDTIAANGNFKVTDNDGKGNGVIIVDFKKAQRKIKGDVKFVAKAPTYIVDADVYFNYEKDNNDKLHFNTVAKKTDKILDSKNKFVYQGKKFELNFHKDGVLSLTGKTHGSVEVVLPTERCLSFKVDREMSENNGVYNGRGEISLSDAAKRGGAASSILYKANIINTNPEKNTYNYEGQFQMNLKDGKELQNSFVIKNLPEGDKLKFDFKSDVTGNVLTKPASISGYYVYVEELTVVDDNYRFKGNYGDDMSFEWAGVSEVKFPEKGDKKFLDDSTVTFRLPFDKAHDIKWVSNVLYLQPDGQETAEFKVVESVQVNADVYKVESNGKVSLDNGSGTLKLLIPHVDPLALDVKYEINRDGEKRASNVDLKARYGKGKTAAVSVQGVTAPHDSTLIMKAHTPQAEQLKKLELNVHTKNPVADTYYSTITVDADGRIYKTESNFVLSKANPVLDIKYSSPSNQKPSWVYVKGTSLSSTQGKVEVKVDNIRDICFDVVSEAAVQKDNVNLKVLANSDNFGWKNYNVEIASKDAGSGKRLEFQATNNNKNILSGSTTFISKQEGPKTIIEGSGAVKLYEEQKSASFKYYRTILGDGNERGIETLFNMAIGERSYVAESRVTNIEYKNSFVYCEEKKQCANAELHSKIDTSKPGVIRNTVNANFDLRKLGVTPEFGLMISDEVSDQKMPQYTLDLHINKEDKKYHLHVYNKPEFGNAKSGITVQLPTRHMAVESVVSYPTNKGLPFPIRGDLSMDLDKNKQGHKTSARFLVDLEVDNDNRQSAVAELAFNHPRLRKEAVARIRGNLQRSSKGFIKVETSASISHPILGRDRETKMLIEASPNRAKLFINTPLVKVIEVDATATIKENLQKGELRFCLLEGKPVQITAMAKDYQYFEFTTDESDRKLSIVGHIQPEQRVDISADILLSGQKKNIAHGALFLDNDMLKSDYGLSKDNYNYYSNALKKDLDNLVARIKELGEKANNDFKGVMQRVEPTLKDIAKSYNDEFARFYKDIADDKTLKEISQIFNDVVQYLTKMIGEVVEVTKPIADKISETYIELSKKIMEMYEKQIEPQLKKIYETIASAVKDLLDGLIDTVAHVTAIVIDFYEKHKPELEELTNTLTAIFKDLTRLLVAQLKEFRTRINQLWSEVSQQMKELPIISQLKEKWQELAVPDQVMTLLQDAYNAVRPLLPTEEVRAFADAVNSYVQKKLRQQQCDDSKELRDIYKKLSTAIQSLANFIRNQLGQYGVPAVTQSGFGGFGSLESFLAPSALSAPTLGGDASTSFISDLLTGDMPDLLALVKSLRPRSYNPLDEVPTKLRAVVVNGQHIFTFDGRHLTFPGTCRYVLAHDYVDRNFTLAIQLNNGQPKSLVLEDKSGSIIELKDNGQVLLDNAVHGFPVIAKDVFAFRQSNGRIGLGSNYGLMAFCTSKLEVCYVEVNGFYLGKLRGLLGDGNNEPYDDFRLPNGKICESEGEFGNAYRLSRSCAQVQTPPHSHDQMHAPLPPACEQVFGGTSPLKPLSIFLDISPFRQACVHACSGDSPQALQQACDLARGYAALALTGLLPAVLPDVCVQCTDADKPRKVGESYELKVPTNKADLIVTFETTQPNERNYKEILVPLVSQVIDSLKTKKITDIKVYLIGITSKYPYPILYDTDLKLKNPKVQFDDESRYSKTPKVRTDIEYVDKLDDFITSLYDTLRIELGLTNAVAGYASVFDLPLRAGAVKHTIGLTGEECVSQFFLVDALQELTYGAMKDNMALSQSFIALTPNLSVGNGKNAGQIIGYTEKSVLMLGDKKHGKDTESLRATLEKTPDACRDYVEGTDGIVFSSTNFYGMNPGQQKEYLTTASAAIIQSMLGYRQVQECTCGYVDPFRVRSLCYTKDRKEVSRRRK